MINEFLKVEHQENWLNEQVDGFFLWQYIRLLIFNEVRKQRGEIIPRQQSVRKPSMFYVAKLAYTKSLLLHATKADLFIRDHYRHVKNEKGNYESIYTAEFLQKNSYKKIIAETYKMVRLDSPLEQSEVYNTADLLIISKLCRPFLKNKKIKKQICQKVSHYVARLNTAFQIQLDSESLVDRAVRLYTSWKVYRWYYKKTLKKIQPKLIMEVVSYEFNNMVINGVAKELGISTVELQHGLMGSGHPAYNFTQKGDYSTFPDNIFTYSEFWNRSTRFPLKATHVIATGFSYIDKAVIQYKIEQKKETNNILFISQWSIGKQLSEFAVALAQYLDEHHKGQFQITYKMHPEERLTDNDNYQLLRQYQDQIEIIHKDGASLYECFGKADIQIGVYSTGLYEGIAFDLKTFILKTEGSGQLKPLVDLGYATYITQVEEIVQALSTPRQDVNIQQFWQKNATQTMLGEVERLINASNKL